MPQRDIVEEGVIRIDEAGALHQAVQRAVRLDRRLHPSHELRGGETGVRPGDERHRAGDERGGHRRPRVGVEPTPDGAVDVGPRRGEIDGGRAPVRVAPQRAGLVHGGDDQLVRGAVARGIRGRDVVVRGLVAGGRDEDDALAVGEVEGVEHRLRIGVAPPACIDDLGPVVDGEIDPVDGRVGRAVALRVEHLQGHDPRAPVDARDADPVVPGGGENARDVSAVAVVVLKVVIAVDEVPAVEVAPVAIAAVGLGVRPEPAGEGGVVNVDPGVKHRDDRRGRARGERPGRGGVHGRHPPLARE